MKIIPPFQVLILGAAMWGIHRYSPVMHYHTGSEYLVSRVLLLIALGLFAATIFQFWKHQTTVSPTNISRSTKLIQSGPYRISRNPVYLVDVMILLAWAVWLAQWLNLLLVLVFMVSMRYGQIAREESVLMNKFGSEYADYRSRVRRWL